MAIPILQETWNKRRPWRKFLTEKEMDSLPAIGVVMADHWAEWHPDLCREIQKEQNLAEYFKRRGNDLADQMDRLMQQGLGEDQAWEIIAEDIFLTQAM